MLSCGTAGRLRAHPRPPFFQFVCDTGADAGLSHDQHEPVRARVPFRYVIHHDLDVDMAVAPDGSGRSLREYLVSEWLSLGEEACCFDLGIQFVNARLPSEKNGHPAGTCWQFYATFSRLEREFNHWFQLEPDVWPVQAGWLDEVASLARNNLGGRWGERSSCRRVWVAGSMPRCRPEYASLDERQVCACLRIRR